MANVCGSGVLARQPVIAVPEALSTLDFDGLEMARYIHPAPTTLQALRGRTAEGSTARLAPVLNR